MTYARCNVCDKNNPKGAIHPLPPFPPLVFDTDTTKNDLRSVRAARTTKKKVGPTINRRRAAVFSGLLRRPATDHKRADLNRYIIIHRVLCIEIRVYKYITICSGSRIYVSIVVYT